MTNIIKGSICPACDFNKLIRINKTLNFPYKGDITSFHNISVDHCTECKEEFLEPETQKLIDERLTIRRKEIDELQK